MLLGIVSDAHGCIEGLDLALDVLSDYGVDEIIFLGDAVGYFPGVAVLDRLMELRISAVLGNHEQMLLSGSFIGKDDIYLLGATRALLRDDHMEFINSMKSEIVIDSSIGRIALMHGAPEDPVCGYLYQDSPLPNVREDGYSHVCIGHTHRPFVRMGDTCLFINVGSCALPRDGGMYGSVCLLDTDDGCHEILRYDVSEAFRRAIKRCRNVHPVIVGLLDRPLSEPLVGRLLS